MVSNFWQIASGSVVKSAFQRSMGLLGGVSDERNMKFEEQCCRIFRQYIFDRGVETEFYMSRGIIEEIFSQKKTILKLFVGLRAKKTSAVFSSTGL